MTEFGHALPPGAVIFEFKIVRTLGAGGFGITYLAEDRLLGSTVALKEFFPADFAQRLPSGHVAPRGGGKIQKTFEWGLASFTQEARTLAKFDHPNIVRVKRLIEPHNGTAYMVMNFIEGENLESLIERARLVPPKFLMTVFENLLDGCDAIHRQGILHRDIKPSNIMISRNDAGAAVAVLIDFGAARLKAMQAVKKLTGVATRGYSPPEQTAVGFEQSYASDIYSVGATVYHLLTGDPPPDSAARHAQPLAPVPPERAAAFPVSFVPAVLKCLDLRMERRPQNIGELRRLLGPLTTEGERGPVTRWRFLNFPKSIAIPEIDRRTLLVGGGTAAAVVVGGAAVYVVSQSSPFSGASHRVKVIGQSSDIALISGESLGQIAATPRGCVVAAHQFNGAYTQMMAAAFSDDLKPLTAAWIDSRENGRAHAILPTDDGGAYVGGRVGSDAVLTRLGPDWTQSWQAAPLSGAGGIMNIVPSGSGVTVATSGDGDGLAQICTYGPGGGEPLSQPILLGLESGDMLERMVALSKGGYALTGQNQKQGNAWVAVVDAGGKVTQRLATTTGGLFAPYDIIQVEDTLYVAGKTYPTVETKSKAKIFVWAIDSSATTQRWIRSDYSGTGGGSGRAWALVDGKTLYLASRVYPDGSGQDQTHARISQVGPDGGFLWSEDFPKPPDNQPIGAIGLAMRGAGDGFALLMIKATDLTSNLRIARLGAGS